MHLHLHSRSIAWKLIDKGFFWDLILPKILGELSSPVGNGKRYFGESQDTPLLANRRPTGCIDLSLSPGRQFITKGSMWIKVALCPPFIPFCIYSLSKFIWSFSSCRKKEKTIQQRWTDHSSRFCSGKIWRMTHRKKYFTRLHRVNTEFVVL